MCISKQQLFIHHRWHRTTRVRVKFGDNKLNARAVNIHFTPIVQQDWGAAPTADYYLHRGLNVHWSCVG